MVVEQKTKANCEKVQTVWARELTIITVRKPSFAATSQRTMLSSTQLLIRVGGCVFAVLKIRAAKNGSSKMLQPPLQ